MITQQGALNTTALVVPDLYVQLVPPQAVLLNGVPSNVLGLVGSACWGPVGRPVVIGSLADYAAAFGPVMNRPYDMATHLAVAALQGASAFRCLRVTDGSETAATATAPGATFAALYPGSLGNGLTVTLAAAMPGAWSVTVALPGLGAERFDNIAGSGAAFWTALAAAINQGQGPLRPASAFVTATATGATTAPAAASVALTGGTDGVAGLTAAALLGADTLPRSGMYALRNQGCALLDLCDADDPSLWTAIDGFAAAEGLYAILTGPAGQTITEAVAAKEAAGLDSSAAKLLHGDWLWWWDAANGVQRLVSPQAFAAGRLANLSPEQSGLNKPLYAVTGSQKLGGPGSGLAAGYSAAELETLFAAGIDLITNPGAGGRPFWTLRLGHNSASNPAISGDNYTRLTNYIATTLNAGMGMYVGRVINAGLLRDIRSTLLGFLNALQTRGMIGAPDGSTAYAVLCDTVNNPATRLALGYVQADVQIRYLGITEKFLVNLDGGTGVLVTTAGGSGGSGSGGSGSGGSGSGGGTTPTPTITITAPGTGTTGTALSLSGTVAPSGDAVSVALASSATTPPTTGLSAAIVTGGSWSASLTPAAAGTLYAWAIDATAGTQAVSPAITVAASGGGGGGAGSSHFAWGSANPGGASYTAGQAGIGVNATLDPGGAASAVQFGFSASATTPPTSWTAATLVSTQSNGDTVWAAYVTAPATVGTYYGWVASLDGSIALASSAVTVH